MAARNDVPSALQRSARRAQETYTKALDSAAASYGAGDRARRTALTAVRRSFDRIGDHWEPKAGMGSNDGQAARRRSNSPTKASSRPAKASSRPIKASSRPARATARGGIDANSSKMHLMDVARQMDIPGRSRMSKPELVDAIRKTDNRSSRAVRRR